ncbi:MAG: sulfatase-like hydrolase/transferase [Planctomycetota bacterium]
MNRLVACLFLLGCLLNHADDVYAQPDRSSGSIERPNILFIFTDDHRWDSLGCTGNTLIRTPHLDTIARDGVRFRQAFVTLSLCSPSRAATLTGRYCSSNGVVKFGNFPLNEGEITFANRMSDAGYVTGVTGKWHLKNSPAECGFEFASTCFSNGTWYNRSFRIHGEERNRKVDGFVDDVVADESIRFLNDAAAGDRPFILWMCTQVPHMDHRHTWPANEAVLSRLNASEISMPDSWQDDLSGKPDYLRHSRNYTKAQQEYGYGESERLSQHIRDYYAAVEQMDASVGRVLMELEQLGLRDSTWIIFMGDNGWLLGEHGMTSKVLPYEESIRVPMMICGPDTEQAENDNLVLNIDLTATILELAGIEQPDNIHGHSLLPLIKDDPSSTDWRADFLYEAPASQLGSQPLWAVRSDRWKLISTLAETGEEPFLELYDLENDPREMHNVASENSEVVQELNQRLSDLRSEIGE